MSIEFDSRMKECCLVEECEENSIYCDGIRYMNNGLCFCTILGIFLEKI